MKSLGNSDTDTTKSNVPDVVFFGDEDAWQLICKASSEDQGWMKSTKAMQLPNGVLVQVTTQQRGPDGSYAVAEAVTFVPGVQVLTNPNRPEGPLRFFADPTPPT